MIPMRGLPCNLFRRYPIAILSSSSFLHRQKNVFTFKEGNWYCTHKNVIKMDSRDTKGEVNIHYGEVVKKNTAFVLYMVIIVVTVAFTGYMCYFIFDELFSSNSPLGIYNRALERCQKDTRVLDALGQPIKVYGEGRRRRNHFSHGVFEKDGDKYFRLKFYMEGVRRKGTVFVEAKEVSGNYELSYIYVKLDDAVGTLLTIDHT